MSSDFVIYIFNNADDRLHGARVKTHELQSKCQYWMKKIIYFSLEFPYCKSILSFLDGNDASDLDSISLVHQMMETILTK